MNDALSIQVRKNRIGHMDGLRVQMREHEKWLVPVLFCAAHVPLALLIYQVRSLAYIHAIACLTVGIGCALSGSRHLAKVVYVAAYIAGAEVFWRMTQASVFWEFGKYATATIFLLALVRNGRFKGGLGLFLYFACLLPSAALVLEEVGWDKSRSAFSFNLTGPLVLLVAGWFFSNVSLTRHQLQRMLLFFAAPTLGIAAIAQYVIQASADIRFTSNASNLTTSGGYGPNQVSAALGLGALMLFLFLVVGKHRLPMKMFALAAMIGLAGQCALTFSRGGLYNVIGAIALASIYFIKDSQTRAKFLPVVLISAAIVFLVVLPRLDALTQGTLSERLRNTHTTNRYDIALAQLQLWQEHPILGVGPGQARDYAGQVAHTEVTRLLAEHGIFGGLALLILIALAVRNVQRARQTINKSLAIAMLTWSFLFMANAGMRVVAPSFAFGLSFLILVPAPTRLSRRRLTYQTLPRPSDLEPTNGDTGMSRPSRELAVLRERRPTPRVAPARGELP